MGDKSKIEWTQATWNPFAGCSKVSAGCKNCYAIRDAHRLSNNTNEKIRKKYAGTVTSDGRNWTGKINIDEEALLLPLRWTRPRKIFVNSMSDLFHPNVPDEWIKKVFTVMALCPQHIFQVLTKRPERMKAYFEKQKVDWTDLGVSEYAGEIECDAFDLIRQNGKLKKHLQDAGWWIDYDYNEWGKKDGWQLYYKTEEIEHLPNVWLGVSVEDQKTADERIPLLLETPAIVRWLSVEPLLGEVDLFLYKIKDLHIRLIDWVVVGGESGTKARPMHPDWVRSIRDQCQAAGVAFFFKQWGEWACITDDKPKDWRRYWVHMFPDGRLEERRCYLMNEEVPEGLEEMKKVGKKKAGRLLDGREWNEMPEVKR